MAVKFLTFENQFLRERADIFFSKLAILLLFLMISGMEFHVEAPSYMKLFFMLLERGLGKRITYLNCHGGYAAVILFFS